MILIRRIYTIYALLIFSLSFLFIFPFLLLCIWVPKWSKLGRKVNHLWASIYFKLIFLDIEVLGKSHVKKGKSYVFVANHFSYLDIPMMGLLEGDVVFVGKSSLKNLPLFGFYFRKLHIMVNRSSIKSRGEVILRAKKAIDNKSSIIIFPEGGITSPEPPMMKNFKDGAFVIAIDKQIPIIPITLSFNHLILPDDGRNLLNFQRGKMVIHEPISTIGFGDKDINALKSECFEVIQKQLLKDNIFVAKD
jgi:1-acyl-sn-glycerol-3-phosphate acyltransferase